MLPSSPPPTPGDLCFMYGVFDPYMSDTTAFTLFTTAMVTLLTIPWITSYAHSQLKRQRNRLIYSQTQIDVCGLCLCPREDPSLGFTGGKLKKLSRWYALERLCVDETNDAELS
ncbi:hypothetical protein BJ875DRAFT_440159 [Amylocarpus encephaloides]|uniref:Uncharacterized protein n=1 Tax=Amylocarpus encephaloides TaxID=45428 RepID=A0A9P8C6F2_9HELO|nr:hypothetical protein BJ875DRAFT_440159 [Amylocarpus encephaloides]